MAADILLSDLTNATTATNGTGVFDVLMKTINLHVEDQYNKNRLTGTDYATVYLGLVQAALAQSQQFVLQEKLQEAQIDGILADNILKAKQLEKLDEEIDLLQTQDNELIQNGIKDRALKDGQITKLTAETGKVTYETSNVLPAQKSLINRQEKGFDDDAKQKLLKQTLDSWSVAYSVAQDANSIPDTIKVNIIDSVMKNAMDNLSITKAINPLGEA